MSEWVRRLSVGVPTLLALSEYIVIGWPAVDRRGSFGVVMVNAFHSSGLTLRLSVVSRL